jgi:BirA family biotin operon repressor/biotin-[acetyl-CoA-carboxylase] ligase
MAGLIDACDRFSRDGLTPFLERWAASDALAGREVRVDAPDGAVTGVACGLGPDGALRVHTAAGEQRFMSGDVSVRAS